MRYLHLLPVSNIVIWLSVLLLVLIAANYLVPAAAVRLTVRSWRVTILGILASLLLFVLLLGLLLNGLRPWNSPLLLALHLVLILAAFAAGAWMPRLLSTYRYGWIAIHLVLGAGFFLLFGTMLMEHLVGSFNVNMTRNYEIAYYVYEQEPRAFFTLLGIMALLFFVFGGQYVSMVLRLYADRDEAPADVNIKLQNGEMLEGLQIKRIGLRYVVAAEAKEKDGRRPAIYRIPVHKVVYMRSAD
ncbi:hypothetical protein [Paenibacillus tepidiphilus]|uniref:hypothetical protein n=1 Tax=Paenibacillus tepidiphilus TaxID=2608683 RepID=UPI00123B5AC3|nr:hypothetical protein [Paenibacillus tepidiphilus]